MNDPSRVLVFGDDGSPCADRAWLWVNAQSWPGFDVQVLTCETKATDLISDETLPMSRWDPANPRLASQAARFGSVTHLHSTASPGALLPTLEPDLMVIGPCGKGTLRRTVLGSTAETMMKHSLAPLVIARATNKARTIAVGVDGSDSALAAARFLATLPLFDAAHRVLVVGVETLGRSMGGEPLRLSEAADMVGEKAEVMRLTSESTPAAALSEVIAGERCDLVVMGKTGTGALGRTLIGSTAASLARSAPIPVMLVPV